MIASQRVLIAHHPAHHVAALLTGGPPGSRAVLASARFLLVDERTLDLSDGAHEARTLSGVLISKTTAALKEWVHFRVYVLPEAFDAPIVVGRKAPADVVLSAPSVSSRHATLRRGKGGRHTIVDEGSKNGTVVDAETIAAGEGGAKALRYGARLRFGLVDAYYADIEWLRSDVLTGV